MRIEQASLATLLLKQKLQKYHQQGDMTRAIQQK